MSTPAPNAWRAPDPRELPQLRRQVVDWVGTNISLMGFAEAIEMGNTSMLPIVEGIEDDQVPMYAAMLLAQGEINRLSEAKLWYASADMTSLAIAAAKTPPQELFNARRLPSETGFMVFEQPIGGYAQPVGRGLGQYSVARPGLTLDTPIVAVSWSRWSPGKLRIDTGRPIRWAALDIRGPRVIDAEFDGVWITFYSTGWDKYGELAPDEPIGNMGGEVITAAKLAEQTRDYSMPQVAYDNETIVRFGNDLSAPPEPDTMTEWVHVVYTAWQLMTQQGKTPLAEFEEVAAPRAFRRREEREGHPTPDGVQVVRLHSAHRPPREASEQDAATSTGRRAPNFTCRWPVRPFRKSVCGNPRKHADGGCEHYDKVFPASIRGPKDKPLRVPEKVTLWDSVPDQ